MSGCACNGGTGTCCGGKKSGPVEPIVYNDELKQYFESLINDSKVMIFIKGTFDEPKCKFTRRLLHLFVDNNIAKFGFFDILTDDRVRNGLRLHSNWKTFPQVFIDGKLLGGLDVTAKVIADGELRSKFPADCFGEIPGTMKVKLLLSEKGVLLFMNGTPDAPADEKSKAAVDILRKVKCEFRHFDVSSSERVARGLADFSEIDVVPQLWIDGEMIGGFPSIDGGIGEGESDDFQWLRDYVEQNQKKPAPAATSGGEAKESKTLPLSNADSVSCSSSAASSSQPASLSSAATSSTGPAVVVAQ